MNMLLFILVFMSSSSLMAQAPQARLRHADSLFHAQQYVQAYDRYAQLYEDNQASLQMLLKMAYIQEGLGNHAESLHLLLEHHTHSYDQDLWKKIVRISQEKGFKGYTLRDQDHIWLFLRKHQNFLLIGLGGLIFISCIRFLYYRFRRKTKGLALLLTSAGLLVGLLYMEHFIPKTGIIADDQSPLMQEPAAAAEIQGELQKGDRVLVIEQNKAWSRILWEKKIHYVRTQHILPATKKES